jgi:hypothetical protein
MCERQSWLILPLEGKFLEVVQNFGELGNEEVEGVSHEDEFCVVGDVAACCAVVDDTGSSRGSLTKSMNVLYFLSVLRKLSLYHVSYSHDILVR